MLVHCLKICIAIERILKKNENIINAGYWILSENRKKYQSVLITKISSRETQKIANPQKFRTTR